MPLAKCPRCTELFDKSGPGVCPACTEAEEADHRTIRDALETNPEHSAEELSELTGIDVTVVLRMIDQGSIVIAGASSGVTCGRCGQPAISETKRLCQKCLQELEQEVNETRKSIELKQQRDAEIGKASVHEAIQAKRR